MYVHMYMHLKIVFSFRKNKTENSCCLVLYGKYILPILLSNLFKMHLVLMATLHQGTVKVRFDFCVGACYGTKAYVTETKNFFSLQKSQTFTWTIKQQTLFLFYYICPDHLGLRVKYMDWLTTVVIVNTSISWKELDIMAMSILMSTITAMVW